MTHWLDKSHLSFNSLLLLERVQISWLPSWDLPSKDLALAFKANPAVEWYFIHKCPSISDWINSVNALAPEVLPGDPEEVRRAELSVLEKLDDLLVYVTDPSIYDAQPFLNWDSGELTSLVDFTGKTVIDVGSGTGRLAFVAAQKANSVYAVEPVGNLRLYILEKARRLDLHNIYAVDGTITEIPFADNFADITLGGHVYGDNPEQERDELERVTRSVGMVILCPGNGDTENEAHRCLVKSGYQWSRFEEPRDGIKRKYWKILP